MEIVYYRLLKELPGAEVGDIVKKCYGFDTCFVVEKSDTRFPIAYAEIYPNWFEPVSKEEHMKMCKENFIKYALDNYQFDKDKALEIFETL